MRARQEIVLSTVNRPFCELTCRAWLCPINIKYLTCTIFHDCYGVWLLVCESLFNFVLKRRLEIAWKYFNHCFLKTSVGLRSLFTSSEIVCLFKFSWLCYFPHKWICYVFDSVRIQVIVYIFRSKQVSFHYISGEEEVLSMSNWNLHPRGGVLYSGEVPNL